MPRRLPDRSDSIRTTPDPAPAPTYESSRRPNAGHHAQSWARHALAALTVGVLGVGTASSIVLTGHAESTAVPAAPAPAAAAVSVPTDTISAPVPRAFRAERSNRSSFREALDETAVVPVTSAAVMQHAEQKRADKLEQQFTSTERKAGALEKKQEAEEKRAKAAVLPLAKYSIAARFGAVGAWSRYHTGFDFSSSIGTTVRAPYAGTVTHAGSGGPSGGWAGTYVTIKHADGTSTLYAHLSSASVHAGETVTAGQTIGRVGMSGRSFGPHLHFEVYPAGVEPADVYDAINPEPWLRALGLNP